jgi:septum formation protein
MARLILASRSPDRLKLLCDAGFEVDAVSADVAEPDPAGFTNLDAGLFHIAHLKAQAVARRGVQGVILAADTVGFVGGRVFGKPADRIEAEKMLRAISGTVHEVRTGWCLLRTRDDLVIGGVERTEIEMRRWTEPELTAYLDHGDWVGRSGAYRIQLPADPFVTRIAGCATNVVGVPIERLQELFAEFPSLAR